MRSLQSCPAPQPCEFIFGGLQGRDQTWASSNCPHKVLIEYKEAQSWKQI